MKSREQIYDEALVLRCQQGDRTAMEELVGRWQPRLWRYAYHLTGDEDAAWDVVQETWAAAVAGIRRIQDVVAFPRWMFRIVGNKAADRLRRATRQRRLTERLEADAEYCAVSPPQHDAIHDAFARLPRDQRALLSLHYVEGFTTAEIAEILGVPQGTVKSRLYHARRALRQIMGLENDD